MEKRLYFLPALITVFPKLDQIARKLMGFDAWVSPRFALTPHPHLYPISSSVTLLQSLQMVWGEPSYSPGGLWGIPTNFASKIAPYTPSLTQLPTPKDPSLGMGCRDLK